MKNLIESLDEYVDGYVPCLSTGEGGAMSDKLWEEVVEAVVSNTKEPVYAGIISTAIDTITLRSQIAERLNCAGVVLPAPQVSQKEMQQHFEHVDSAAHLPLIVYNTDEKPIQNTEQVQELEKIEGVVGFKDSSSDIDFFKQLIELKTLGNLKLSLLQGMDNLLSDSQGCDGCIAALVNLEPVFCRQVFEDPEGNRAELLNLFEKYSLGKNDWFSYIKKFLKAQKTIASSEQVQ